MVLGVNWADRWPEKRRRDSPEEDEYHNPRSDNQQGETTSRYGDYDGTYQPSLTRDERADLGDFARPANPQHSPALHPSHRKNIGNDLPSPEHTRYTDYPLSPHSRSSENTVDIAPSKMNKAESHNIRHLYNADEPPRGPRSAKRQKTLAIETAPPPYAVRRDQPEHPPAEMAAVRSRSRGPHRSFSGREDVNGPPTADCYRPVYQRRLTDNAIHRSLKTPISPNDTATSAGGPKTGRSEPKALSEQNVLSELNSSLERNAHLSEDNDRPSEQNAKLNALVQIQNMSSAPDSIPLLRVDMLQQFNNLAEAIKLSSSSTMRGDRSRREAEWRARLHQRHLKHRETFPTLFEETKYRAGRAEQRHQTIEDEADRGQKRQEKATAALTSTFQKIQLALNGGLPGRDSAEIANMKADFQAMKESMMETTVTEVASLKTDLRSTKESLENARREIDHINRNALTDEVLEVRLQQAVNGLVPRKVHDASEIKLANLTLDSNNRKTELTKLHDFVESVTSNNKHWSNLFDKHETKLGGLKDDASKEEASRTALEKSLRDLQQVVAGNTSSVQGVFDLVEKQKKQHDKELETFRNKMDEHNDELEDVKSKARTLEMAQISGKSQSLQAHQACVSRDDLAKVEQKFEVGNEKLLQTIREEQGVATETIMQEAQATTDILDQQVKDLVELKADGVALRQAVAADSTSRQSAGVLLDPAMTSSNFPVHQSEATMKLLADQIKDVGARNVALEREIRVIRQFVINQQQKFDGLTTTQLTQNMINTMAQMYPAHPAHITAQINQLSQNCRAVEETVRLLLNNYGAIDIMVKNGFVTQLEPIGDKIRELSSSQSQIRQDCTALCDRTAAEVTDFKAQTQGDFARVTNDVSVLLSEVGRLKNRPIVASPTPPSMGSRLPSISVSTAQVANEAQARASRSDSETPLHARNRSSRRVSSNETPNHSKRRRLSISSDDDNVPLSAGARKRNKGIRRLNKSMGGFS